MLVLIGPGVAPWPGRPSTAMLVGPVIAQATSVSPRGAGGRVSMRVTVLGAGSWGTTVAALLCRRDHEVLLWARNPEVAAEVDGQRTNEAYLPGSRLPARLRATADLERASRHAELLVVGVPTAAVQIGRAHV